MKHGSHEIQDMDLTVYRLLRKCGEKARNSPNGLQGAARQSEIGRAIG